MYSDRSVLGSEVAGKITLKHVYEIAKIKSEDPPLELFELQDICKMVIATARTCGIEVVRELDPKEYEQFLEQRKIYAEEFRQELDAIKEAKMLRTA